MQFLQTEWSCGIARVRLLLSHWIRKLNYFSHTVPSGLTHKCIIMSSLGCFPDITILFRLASGAAIQLALLAGLPPPPRMNLSQQTEAHRWGSEITDLQRDDEETWNYYFSAWPPPDAIIFNQNVCSNKVAYTRALMCVKNNAAAAVQWAMTIARCYLLYGVDVKTTNWMCTLFWRLFSESWRRPHLNLAQLLDRTQ